jgi:peptidoglycan/xylan/chitin deacetylase (PgdA/CDA1 family)
MAACVARLKAELGQPIRHFSYPFGDVCSAGPREFDIARELGFLTAVTTRKGVLHASHRASPTALPRVSLNGDYQDTRYTQTLLTGLPFALRDLAKRVLPGRAAA